MCKILKPTFMADSLETLDTDAFINQIKALGIRGVTYDLDDTLAGHFDRHVTDAVLAVIVAVYDSGIEHQGIISNAGSPARSERVHQIAELINQTTGKEFLVVTSHDHRSRKPATKLYKVAAASLGLDAKQICHVGDQLLKDVLGANRAGYGASLWLTEPIGDMPHWLVQYVQRPFERWLIPRFRDVALLNKR